MDSARLLASLRGNRRAHIHPFPSQEEPQAPHTHLNLPPWPAEWGQWYPPQEVCSQLETLTSMISRESRKSTRAPGYMDGLSNTIQLLGDMLSYSPPVDEARALRVYHSVAVREQSIVRLRGVDVQGETGAVHNQIPGVHRRRNRQGALELVEGSGGRVELGQGQHSAGELVGSVKRERVQRRPLDGDCPICYLPLSEDVDMGYAEADSGFDAGDGNDDGEGDGEESGYSSDRYYSGEEDHSYASDRVEEYNTDTDTDTDIDDDDDDDDDEEQRVVWCKACCGINFHAECIKHWTHKFHDEIKVTCPACRKYWKY